MLKAISLHQPYASLVALGEKMNETRGRKFNYSGELAICSTANQSWRSLADVVHFRDALAKHGFTRRNLPFGCVLAVVHMIDCVRAADIKGLHPLEKHFGDYSPDRFAYRLSNVRILGVPVPVKGGQFIFHLRPEVEAAVRAQLL